MKQFIIIITTIISLLLVSVFIMVDAHEQVHVQIYKNYGCSNISYVLDINSFLNNNPLAYTRCNNWSNVRNYDDMRFLHSLNEIYGYQIQSQTLVIVTVLMAMFMVMSMVIFMIIDKR